MVKLLLILSLLVLAVLTIIVIYPLIVSAAMADDFFGTR